MSLHKFSKSVTAVICLLLLCSCKNTNSSDSSAISSTLNSSCTSVNSVVSSKSDNINSSSSSNQPVSSTVESISSKTVNSNTTDNSCFENSAFIGNSLIDDLNTYGIIDNADFYARTGLTVSSVFTKPVVGKKTPIMQEVSKKPYKKVFLMFGLNELGWSYSDIFIEDYGKIIDSLKKSQPNAKIYVQSLFPVSAKRSEKNSMGVNNKQIFKYNSLLKNLCKEKKVIYLDVASALANQNDVLPEDASSDGIHPNVKHCKIWVDYIRSHC